MTYAQRPGFWLIALAMICLSFVTPRLSRDVTAQGRLQGPPTQIREVDEIIVVGEGATMRLALEAAHQQADDVAVALKSSWGRLLRRVARIRVISAKDGQVRVEVTYHLATSGIVPELLLPNGAKPQ